MELVFLMLIAATFILSGIHLVAAIVYIRFQRSERSDRIIWRLTDVTQAAALCAWGAIFVSLLLMPLFAS